MTEPQNISGNNSGSDYHALVNDVDHLVSLPTICVKVMNMLNDPHSTAKDLERVLIQDPPLTAQLLRMANSPFYGLRSQVDTLSRAVSVIGTKRIRNLVLAVSAIKSFDKLTNGIISIENFWSHSIYTGLIANILGQHSSIRQNDSIFIAGLLHDIGQLVIFNKRPDDVRIALTLMQDSAKEADLYLYEREVMGFDHMQVGSELARRWLLPENLIACIQYHHIPSLAPAYNIELALIYIANRLASLAELHSNNLDDIPPVSKQMWEITGLSPRIIEQVLVDAQEQFESAQSILLAK